ncbi:hypothetical protein ACFXKD_03720 [Nocardiopsis aegyptia]|uniref:hypothetical protein n=1 Tax=Nocardiopsis aegyptia TaxID=220378 RepID=UPI00366C42B9
MRTLIWLWRSTRSEKCRPVSKGSSGSGLSSSRSTAKCSPMVRARTDPPRLVFFVPELHHLVQLNQGGDLGHRDEVVAAKPSDLTLHPALLMGALDPRAAVEALDAVVGAKRRPPLGLHPLAGEPQDLGDCGLEVVVAQHIDALTARAPVLLKLIDTSGL